jgi:hypothetical protein
MATGDDIGRAPRIVQAFGRNRAIPVRTRWQETFPDVTVEQMQMWDALFREPEDVAYGVGRQVWNREIGGSEAAAMIARRAPQSIRAAPATGRSPR